MLETGKVAGRANGAVMASYGDTVVLATAVSQEASSDIDYFPLSVDYEERLYAGGRISTSRFIKRENRPSDKAVLTSRLIDRCIRPLFPKDYQAEVQVIVTVLSIDGQNDPDVVSIMAASCALAISDIPWNGPISSVRIGSQNDGFIINPTEDERKSSTMDMVIACSRDEIVMVEAGAGQVNEESIGGAMQFGLKESVAIYDFIAEFAKEAGRPKQVYIPQKADEAQDAKIRKFVKEKIMADFQSEKSQDEGWFGDNLKILEEEFCNDDGDVSPKIVADILEDEVAAYLRGKILDKKKRLDGRGPDDIREISINVGVLPRTHGSAIFERGDTQVLSIVTLGQPALEQLIEGMEGEATKRYMHHYNFPPFSVGETRRRGAPGRREIGHGVLAEKSVLPLIPLLDDFPYTIRIVSEVLSSAGSTSMASACGSTLALMDAGVPIKEPVAGISVGLITAKGDKTKYVTIVDIAYQEDSQGDMDFKVAGTKNGITAIQMDTKLDGVPVNILKEALQKAKTARLEIIKKIIAAIPAPREKISQYAPKVILIKIDPSKIGDVIGSGGRIINKIIAETGAAIDINNEGTITISSKDSEACKKASEWIEAIVKEFIPGEVYQGKVSRILPFGAMVEILPGKEGLVHISELAPHRVNKVEDVVKVGQEVKVTVVEIDDQGRVNLSMIGGERPQRPQRNEKTRFDSRRQDDRQNRNRMKRY